MTDLVNMRAHMRTRKKGNEPIRTRSEAFQRRLRQALKQPGVSEFLRVYENWQRYHAMLDAHAAFSSTQQFATLSDSSGPLVQQVC